MSSKFKQCLISAIFNKDRIEEIIFDSDTKTYPIADPSNPLYQHVYNETMSKLIKFHVATKEEVKNLQIGGFRLYAHTIAYLDKQELKLVFWYSYQTRGARGYVDLSDFDVSIG